MNYIAFALLIACQLVAGEQHPIVYGKYFPVAVTEDELRTALGTTDPLDLKPLGGGYSGGFLYTMTYQGKSYVVRRSGGIFGQAGIPQELAIFESASRAGIAPKQLYADAKSGLLIMEKIESILPAEFNPGMLAFWPDIMSEIAAGLRVLRDLKVDPAIVTDRFDAVYFKQMAEQVDKSLLPPQVRATVDSLLELPVDTAKKVIVHTDLHARNILFDGKNLFFVDWELAGWGPEGYDAASMANFQGMTNSQGIAFYELYLQRKATPAEAARFARLRATQAATRGTFLLSNNQTAGDDTLAGIRDDSPVITMRNIMYQLDRQKIAMDDLRTAYLCGLEWLRFAGYLLKAQP